ncbi:hypothetical protein OHB24_20110 [Kribbella sp. NBC_00482]
MTWAGKAAISWMRREIAAVMPASMTSVPVSPTTRPLLSLGGRFATSA